MEENKVYEKVDFNGEISASSVGNIGTEYESKFKVAESGRENAGAGLPAKPSFFTKLKKAMNSELLESARMLLKMRELMFKETFFIR